jgi:hypothetical protein
MKFNEGAYYFFSPPEELLIIFIFVRSCSRSFLVKFRKCVINDRVLIISGSMRFALSAFHPCGK